MPQCSRELQDNASGPTVTPSIPYMEASTLEHIMSIVHVIHAVSTRTLHGLLAKDSMAWNN